MNNDFTLTTYTELLRSIKQSGYTFYTFEDWCRGKATGRYVILRHDVDSKAGNSLMIAGIEAEMGVRATYYFRIVPQSNHPEIIRAIAGLGHEIGYHYEDLSLFNGNTASALDHFNKQLAYFRQFYPVCTICMHGSPASKWDNRDLWKSVNYKNLGVLGEPYLDFLNQADTTYFTDTARMWDGDKYNIRDKRHILAEKPTNDAEPLLTTKDNNNFVEKSIHSTFDLIEWFEKKPTQSSIMITTHPQRWSDKTTERLLDSWKQSIKNQIKKLLIRIKG